MLNVFHTEAYHFEYISWSYTHQIDSLPGQVVKTSALVAGGRRFESHQGFCYDMDVGEP